MNERRKRADALVRTQRQRVPYLFIGGLEVESEANATVAVTNPATGETLGRCPVANARDVNKAVDAAYAARRSGLLAPESRAAMLLALAEQVESEASDLAILSCLETGKAYRDVLRYDVRRSVRALRAFAGWAGKRPGEAYDLSSGRLGLVFREAQPVVAASLAASDTLGAGLRKIAASLAVGSSLVLRPPPNAPLSMLRIGSILRELGLPPGLVNIVTGYDATVETLAEHPGVSVMSYAGSIENARRALVGAARSNLKPIHFELGGKSACIIFDDGDMRSAVDRVVRAIFGSECTKPSAPARLVVHRNQYERVATQVVARAKSTILGDPLDEHTELGAMPSAEHLDRVLAYVDLGRKEGAKLVAGGVRDRGADRARGAFMTPTAFIDVPPQSRLALEDIGGPVLSLIPFDKEEEAVSIANETNYGLAASIWTRDLARGHRIAQQLTAGTVWLNQLGVRDPALPFGGSGLSGSGRDLGVDMLDQWMRTRTVVLGTGD